MSFRIVGEVSGSGDEETSLRIESREGEKEQGRLYEEGQRVFAYHQHLIYEAKVLKVQIRSHPTPQPFYFLHYQGWNDRWDEWVDSSRILPYTEASRRMQEELKASRVAAAKGEGRMRKKRLLQANQTLLDFKQDIPIAIKKRLLEDFQNIITHKYLVSLPKRPSAKEIIEAYGAELSPDTNPKCLELLGDILEYFNKGLGTIGLYKFERQQYSQLLKKNQKQDLTQIYGVEHLLRLLVKLPEFISADEMGKESLEIVKSTVVNLFRFISRNIESYAAAYDPAPPEYIRLAS